MINKLADVFNTLNRLQVSGYANVTMLAGSMQVLKDVIEEMQAQASAPTSEEQK